MIEVQKSTRASFLSAHGSSICLIIFPPLLLYLAANALFSSQSTPIWDAEQIGAPYYSLLADSVRSFRPIYWNPLSCGGSLDYAVPDLFLLSPVTAAVAFIFGGSIASYKLYWFLVWAFGGWGIAALGIHLKAPVWGICCVCAGFLFSGIYCGEAEHTSCISAMSVVPWIIWRFDVALETRRLRPALEAGLLWGLSALCSYIGLTALTGCYLVLWLIGRLLIQEKAIGDNKQPANVYRRVRFGTLAIGLFAVAGVCIMAPILTGLLFEMPGYSSRAGSLSREVAITENVMDPGSLFSFATPYVSLLKYLYSSRVWPNTDLSMISAYSGVPATVFAIAALFLKGQSHWRTYLFAMGLFFLIAALGYHTPLRGWLYDFFPPTRFFRHPGLFRLYWAFTLCYLGLYATRDIHEAMLADDRQESKNLLFIATMMAFVGIVWTFSFCASNTILLPAMAVVHLIGIWGAVVACCCLAFIPTLPRERFQRIFPGMMLIIACVDSALSFELNRPIMCMTGPSAIQFWDKVESSHVESMNLNDKGFNRGLSAEAFEPNPYRGMLHNFQLIWKTNVLRNYSPLKNEFYAETSTTPYLAQAALGMNRTWFAAAVPEIPANAANFAAYSARAKELNAAPVVRHTRESVVSLSAETGQVASAEIARLTAPQNVPIHILSFSPNELSFETTTPSDGWLLSTERWAKGWQAKVNGVETPVLPGNFIFRCVKVPAGRVTVEFSYHPFGMPGLLYLSATVVAILGSLSIAGMIGNFRAKAAALESTGLADPSQHSPTIDVNHEPKTES